MPMDGDLPWAASTQKFTWPKGFARSSDKLKSLHDHGHMATKLGKVRIYNEKLPSIKSKGPLIKWSCMVMRNITRSVISLLSKGIWTSSLGRCWPIIRSFHSLGYSTFRTHVHLESCDKLRTLHLSYRNTSVHQTLHVRVFFEKQIEN